jgi:hypothetical protein
MTWTTDKPTEPGYYWAKRPGDYTAEIWHIRRTGPNPELLMVSIPRVDYIPLNLVRYVLWAGPIQQPALSPPTT